MSNYWGDLADQAAESLKQEQLRLVKEEKMSLDDNVKMVDGVDQKSLFTKLEFSWRSSDKLILERIRLACQQVTVNEYRVVSSTVDTLYSSVRVPELTAQGVYRRDENGRLVFKKDEKGSFIEDWSSLNGQDLEVAILKLQTSKIELATRTNDLLQEAIFAKYIYNDDYYDGYKSLMEGTQGDRTAQANRVTREQRYFAFYKFCLWQSSDVLLKEISGLQRVMERIRDWRIRSERS